MILAFKTMVVGNPNASGTILQNDINIIILWADKWVVRANPSKSESLIISRKNNVPIKKMNVADGKTDRVNLTTGIQLSFLKGLFKVLIAAN